jgi:hypothetical protein
MSKHARAGLTGMLLAFVVMSPAGQAAPPEKKAPGAVRVHYERHKTTECKRIAPPKDGEQCEATVAPAATAADIVFQPTGAEGEPATDGRKEAKVSFAKNADKQTKEVSLAAGKWTLVWTAAGAKLKERFFVVAGDEFDITVEGTDGACKASGNKCSVDDGKKSRSIEIPEERLD